MREKETKRNKGITLISLVITIVVLLIFAAVSIATLTGPNGILTQANEAKTENEKAADDELRKLAQAEASMNFENQEYVDNTSTTTNKKVVIPAGFALSPIEGEQKIDTGLVIIDKAGNEFVWVPVDDFNQFKREAGYYNGNLDTIVFPNCQEPTADGIANTTEVEKMYKSVKDNKGFYIGRYEAGNEGGTYNTTDEKWEENGKVVVKKGANVYNNVMWNSKGNMDDTLTEGIGALELSRNFAKENGYTNVTSTLCYGVQWDAVMRWMKNEPNPNVAGKTYVQDSTGMGNYDEDANINSWKGKVTETGKIPEYAVKNIYDIAGNVNEWTMETSIFSVKCFRGGNYEDDGFNRPSSLRNSGLTNSYASDSVGFRLTLYVNV